MKRHFDSLAREMSQSRQMAHEICRQFSRSPSKGNLKRLKSLFTHCGESVFIEAGFYCDYGHFIELGDRVFININCTILDAGRVSIGHDTLIGPNVQILAVTHDVDPKVRLEKGSYAQDVIIGSNVWLAAGVIISPGVTVGNNSVVGAGSVVTSDVEANSLYVGHPAVKVKSI